jgi:hypothetical protein
VERISGQTSRIEQLEADADTASAEAKAAADSAAARLEEARVAAAAAAEEAAAELAAAVADREARIVALQVTAVQLYLYNNPETSIITLKPKPVCARLCSSEDTSVEIRK